MLRRRKKEGEPSVSHYEDEYLSFEYKADNFWLICCNCEYQISINECFFDDDDDLLSDSDIKCPSCGSHELRKVSGRDEWY